MKASLSCPLYINILCFAIFLFLFGLILRWITNHSRKEGATGKTPYATNPKYTYKPSTTGTDVPTIEFGLSDLDTELEQACSFLKIDSSLSYVDPSAISVQTSDYSVPTSDLKINTLYDNSVHSSKKEGIVNAMDASYGSIFDSNVIKDWPIEKIVSIWNGMNSVQIDDALYSSVNYFVINSGKGSNRACLTMATDTSANTLGNYFLQGIIANKFNSNGLLKLKNAYYAIIKPRFLANAISTIYWNNWQTLMNSDGKSRDSIVFVINTMNDLVSDATLPVDLSGTNTQNIISTDKVPTPFTMDSLRLYQTMSVSHELYMFINKFPTMPENPIQTTPATFYVGFQKYLDTLNKVSVPSTLAFVIKNPPNRNNCSTVLNSDSSSKK